MTIIKTQRLLLPTYSNLKQPSPVMTNRHRSRRNSQKNSQVRNIKQKSPDLNIEQKSPDPNIEQKWQILEFVHCFKCNPFRMLYKRYEKVPTNADYTVEHGLKCKIERNRLRIKCYGDKLLAMNPEGRLLLYDISSGRVLRSTPTGKPLHVSYGSLVSLADVREYKYKHAKGSELADLNCKASDPDGTLNVVFVPSKSETVLHVNQRTGQLSPKDSVNDEILCIKRFDFQITCIDPETGGVLGYRRITSIHVLEVSRGDARLCMGQTLVKPGTVGKISMSNRVIGEGDKDTVLVEGEIQKRAVIVCVKKGQSHDDDDVKRVVSNVIDVCGANPNFVNVYAMEKDRDFSYVAIEHCDTSLREFIQSFHNRKSQHLKDRDKLLKLIWGIVAAIACLHYNGISHGNIDINNIFVDKYSRAKIQVIGKGWRIRVASKDRFSLSKEVTDDMHALGHVIYFCFTGVEYNGENLYRLKPKNYLKPIHDCPDTLDFLRKLLDKNAAQRVTALQASNHTLFWSSSKKLRFIRAVTERLELKGPKLLLVINTINKAVFGERWDTNLPKDFVDVMKDGSYSGIINNNSSYGLLCIIRNLITHETRIRNESRIIQSQQEEVQEMFGPAGFESYFRRKFPNLVNEVHNAMREHLGEERNFQQFYKKNPF